MTGDSFVELTACHISRLLRRKARRALQRKVQDSRRGRRQEWRGQRQGQPQIGFGQKLLVRCHRRRSAATDLLSSLLLFSHPAAGRAGLWRWAWQADLVTWVNPLHSAAGNGVSWSSTTKKISCQSSRLKRHAGVAAALPSIPESRWLETTPLEAVRGFLPTIGDCFVFVMAAHENMHLGQLSAWRRVQGMGRV